MGLVRTFLNRLILTLLVLTCISATNISSVRLNSPSKFFDNASWNALGQYIVSSHYSIYVINWRGIGGYVNIGKNFINDIQKAQRQGKRIVFNLVGPAWSVHAFVTCYGDSIRFSGGYLAFHADAVNGRPVRQSSSYINSQLAMCVSRGILTNKDVQILWAGNEVYKSNGKTWYKHDRRL